MGVYILMVHAIEIQILLVSDFIKQSFTFKSALDSWINILVVNIGCVLFIEQPTKRLSVCILSPVG